MTDYLVTKLREQKDYSMKPSRSDTPILAHIALPQRRQ